MRYYFCHAYREVKNDVSLWKHVQSFKALHIIHMDFHWENVCVCQDPKTKKTKHTFIVDYKRIYSWKSDKPEQLKRQPEEHLKKHKPEEDQVVTIKMCLNFMVSWFQNDKKNLAQEIGLNENDYCIWEKMKDYMERFAWNSWLKYANAGDPTEVSTFDD
ncbi:unnamed protein product [Amoebophrya sp. A120]|nr:unnamed protein product [Amoebophrya sp. A120]|eukprot:GSA120T00013380001.1